eukprot:COSAG01_NODE_410_length_17384_cov_20.323691_5_plen_550_part_00
MIGLDPPAEYNPCDAAQVLLARTTTMLNSHGFGTSSSDEEEATKEPPKQLKIQDNYFDKGIFDGKMLAIFANSADGTIGKSMTRECMKWLYSNYPSAGLTHAELTAGAALAVDAVGRSLPAKAKASKEHHEATAVKASADALVKAIEQGNGPQILRYLREHQKQVNGEHFQNRDHVSQMLEGLEMTVSANEMSRQWATELASCSSTERSTTAIETIAAFQDHAEANWQLLIKRTELSALQKPGYNGDEPNHLQRLSLTTGDMIQVEDGPQGLELTIGRIKKIFTAEEQWGKGAREDWEDPGSIDERNPAVQIEFLKKDGHTILAGTKEQAPKRQRLKLDDQVRVPNTHTNHTSRQVRLKMDDDAHIYYGFKFDPKALQPPLPGDFKIAASNVAGIKDSQFKRIQMKWLAEDHDPDEIAECETLAAARQWLLTVCAKIHSLQPVTASMVPDFVLLGQHKSLHRRRDATAIRGCFFGQWKSQRNLAIKGYARNTTQVCDSLNKRLQAVILRDWVRRRGRGTFAKRWHPFVIVRPGGPEFHNLPSVRDGSVL